MNALCSKERARAFHPEIKALDARFCPPPPPPPVLLLIKGWGVGEGSGGRPAIHSFIPQTQPEQTV